MSLITRREFLGSAAATTAGIALTRAAALTAPPAGKPPNLVYCFPDQMRRHAMGFMKQDPVLTPVLDAFAKESVVLSDACSTSPVCSPHRASLMTGQYAPRNGFYTNAHANYPDVSLDPNTTCFTDVLHDNGYHVGYIGKWHLEKGVPGGKGYIPPYVPREHRHRIDFWYSWASRAAHHSNPAYWKNDAPFDEQILVDAWSPIHETDVTLDYIANKGGQYRDPTKPFAVFLSMNPPHPPYNDVPLAYRELYKDAGVEDLLNRPNVDTGEGSRGQQALRTVHGYLACVTGVDAQFGRILKTLREQGLEEDTIVIFTSDHGEMMGSHGQMGKSRPWEESFGVPFLVRWKGRLQPRTDDLRLGSPDIMPTVLSLMGLGEQIPDSVEGSSWADALLQKPGASRPEFAWYWSHFLGRGLRTDRHMCFFEFKGKGELQARLFDLQEDPYQMSDIAADHPGLVSEFGAEVKTWLQAIQDPFKNQNRGPSLLAKLDAPRTTTVSPGSSCREACVPCSGEQPCTEKCSQVGDCPPRPCGVVERCVEGHVFSEATCSCVSSGG